MTTAPDNLLDASLQENEKTVAFLKYNVAICVVRLNADKRGVTREKRDFGICLTAGDISLMIEGGD